MEEQIAGTVVTLPDGSTLSSGGGNQTTSLSFHGKIQPPDLHDLEHFEVVEPLHQNSGHISGVSPLNIACPYTLWRKAPERTR